MGRSKEITTKYTSPPFEKFCNGLLVINESDVQAQVKVTSKRRMKTE
jgi:hypothetical protein